MATRVFEGIKFFQEILKRTVAGDIKLYDKWINTFIIDWPA